MQIAPGRRRIAANPCRVSHPQNAHGALTITKRHGDRERQDRRRARVRRRTRVNAWLISNQQEYRKGRLSLQPGLLLRICQRIHPEKQKIVFFRAPFARAKRTVNKRLVSFEKAIFNKTEFVSTTRELRRRHSWDGVKGYLKCYQKAVARQKYCLQTAGASHGTGLGRTSSATEKRNRQIVLARLGGVRRRWRVMNATVLLNIQQPTAANWARRKGFAKSCPSVAGLSLPKRKDKSNTQRKSASRGCAKKKALLFGS